MHACDAYFFAGGGHLFEHPDGMTAVFAVAGYIPLDSSARRNPLASAHVVDNRACPPGGGVVAVVRTTDQGQTWHTVVVDVVTAIRQG